MANQANQIVLVDPDGYTFVFEATDLTVELRSNVGLTMFRNYGKPNQKAFQTNFTGANDTLRYPNLNISAADLITLINENSEVGKYLRQLLLKAAAPYLIDEEITIQKGSDPEVVKMVETAKKASAANQTGTQE